MSKACTWYGDEWLYEQLKKNTGGMMAQAKVERGTFEWFMEHVKNLCEANAKAKGYNNTGVDGKNELLEFINGSIAPNHGHALGEIVYKTIRYKNKRDKLDLIKIAAWAYLLWKHDEGLD